MNVKLILAEGIEILKKGEDREIATDQLLEKMTKASPNQRDFPHIKRLYNNAYDTFIKGCEVLNFCRRSGMEIGDPELAHFCAERMTKYMNRCEQLRAKETNILTSVEQADACGAGGGGSAIEKEGFEIGEIIFAHSRTKPVKGGAPIEYQQRIEGGSYHIQVKNYDDYSIAAPVINTTMVIANSKKGQNLKYVKRIPSRCAWGKYLGVVEPCILNLQVASDAWVRESHVEVVVRTLIPKSSSQHHFSSANTNSSSTTNNNATTTTTKKEEPLLPPSQASSSSSTWIDDLPPLPMTDPMPAHQIPQLFPMGGGGMQPVEGVPAPYNGNDAPNPNNFAPPNLGYPVDFSQVQQNARDPTIPPIGCFILPNEHEDDDANRAPMMEPLGGHGDPTTQYPPQSNFGGLGFDLPCVPQAPIGLANMNAGEGQRQEGGMGAQEQSSGDSLQQLSNLQVPHISSSTESQQQTNPSSQEPNSSKDTLSRGNEPTTNSVFHRRHRQLQAQKQDELDPSNPLFLPQVNPPNATLRQRLDRLTKIVEHNAPQFLLLDTPTESKHIAPDPNLCLKNNEEKQFHQALCCLSQPTEIDFTGMDDILAGEVMKMDMTDLEYNPDE